MSSTDLVSYLSRKRKTLQDFVVDQKIESYEQIVEYCKRRGCLPISKEAFEVVLPKKVLQVEQIAVENNLSLDTELQTLESTDEKLKIEKRFRKRSKSNISSDAPENEENRTADTQINS